jgi:hypothetical protein
MSSSSSIVAVLTRLEKPTKSKIIRCNRCGATETSLSNRRKWISEDGDSIIIRKYPNWSKGMCFKCYNKYISNPIHRPKDNPKRMHFKEKRLFLKESPRIGVCNTCRAITGQINAQRDILCKITHINHFQYDEQNPLKHTLEQCVACHRHYHKKT